MNFIITQAFFTVNKEDPVRKALSDYSSVVLVTEGIDMQLEIVSTLAVFASSNSSA